MDSLENYERVLALSRLVDQWAEENLGCEPDWGPLEAVLPLEWCGGFMWMQRVEENGMVIELYKHGITRRYLNLDQEGRAYRFTGSRYVITSVERAIGWVFEDLEEMGWSRETNYDDEFIVRKYKALREAGWTVITTGSSALSQDEQQGTDNDHSHESHCCQDHL
jgi:hypothetical protein